MGDMVKFTLRIDADVMDKLRTIAEKHYRTVNKELEMLIRHYVSTYDAKRKKSEFEEESEDE